MNWQVLAIRTVLAADFLIFVTWVALYSRVHWRETAVGRHLMAFAVVIACLLGLTFLRAWLGAFVFWLWLLGLIALGAVGLQRTALLIRLQRERKEKAGSPPSME